MNEDKGEEMLFKKKRFLLIVLMITCALAFKLYIDVQSPFIHSQSALLFDVTNDDILYEKDVDVSYPVASLSKLMTIYIVLDLLEHGTIHWNDEVIVSSIANDIVFSAAKIPVDSGRVLTVQDLFHSMVISSANNATIALAEYISGSEVEFTRLMNDKADQLGLSSKTHFINSTGLPQSGMANKMSARDVVLLAKNLMNDHHHILEITSLEHDYIDAFGIDLFTTNKMLNTHNDLYLKEVDGLKTGYTAEAGYCFVGTAEKEGKRLISVIMNAPSDEDRFNETKRLLAYGFGEFNKPSLKQMIKSYVRK